METNHNLIQEEIKSRINAGNACYHWVKESVFANVLSKKHKGKKYETIIQTLGSYGCESWSLI
jgi:hypothetical protein